MDSKYGEGLLGYATSYHSGGFGSSSRHGAYCPAVGSYGARPRERLRLFARGALPRAGGRGFSDHDRREPTAPSSAGRSKGADRCLHLTGELVERHITVLPLAEQAGLRVQTGLVGAVASRASRLWRNGRRITLD